MPKKRKPSKGPMFAEERNWLTLQELAYLCSVSEGTAFNWYYRGAVTVIPDLKPLSVTEEEARRVYVLKGGSPEGGWRGWPRALKYSARNRG